MDFKFNQTLAKSYKNQSQKARVLTEAWISENMFCPRCGHPQIQRFPNNQAVADFFCPDCQNEFELKSKNGAIGRKVSDGAYDTFIQRITSNNNPDFLFLSYNALELCANDLLIVPKHIFTPAIVEKRKPLAKTAKRAGWVGCNILFDQIPQQGRIALIHNRISVEKDVVLSNMAKASLLQFDNIQSRGWVMDVLLCINQIENRIFSLDDMYQFEIMLAAKHPNNRNIRPKIRQQLQVLRDKGVIAFLGRGKYQRL